MPACTAALLSDCPADAAAFADRGNEEDDAATSRPAIGSCSRRRRSARVLAAAASFPVTTRPHTRRTPSLPWPLLPPPPPPLSPPRGGGGCWYQRADPLPADSPKPSGAVPQRRASRIARSLASAWSSASSAACAAPPPPLLPMSSAAAPPTPSPPPPPPPRAALASSRRSSPRNRLMWPPPSPRVQAADPSPAAALPDAISPAVPSKLAAAAAAAGAAVGSGSPAARARSCAIRHSDSVSAAFSSAASASAAAAASSRATRAMLSWDHTFQLLCGRMRRPPPGIFQSCAFDFYCVAIESIGGARFFIVEQKEHRRLAPAL